MSERIHCDYSECNESELEQAVQWGRTWIKAEDLGLELAGHERLWHYCSYAHASLGMQELHQKYVKKITAPQKNARGRLS